MWVFLIIILAIILFWPAISRWLRGFISRRAEDSIRRMMGMPSRKEEEKMRRKRDSSGRQQKKTKTPEQNSREADRQEALRSMKDNAMDVEYTEYKEFSQTRIAVEDEKGDTTVYTESQVTDVEFIEIKESNNQEKK